MTSASGSSADFFALIVYSAAAAGLIGLLLLAAQWLGSGGRSEVKESPFESGISPSGNARLAYPVPFYLVAIFFIIFDVESVFIFTWGVAWDILGLTGMIHISFFIVLLMLGLAWLWIKGGLDWGPSAEGQRSSEPDRSHAEELRRRID